MNTTMHFWYYCHVNNNNNNNNKLATKEKTMKNHEVLFKNAKKDKNGFVNILVRFGEWYVPMLGKPMPLTKDDMGEVNEKSKITRLNLTRWILKDIPEVAKLVGNLADGKASWLFYYNGNEGTWNFWNEPFAGIDEDCEDFDEKIDKLDMLIDDIEDKLYCPHLDNEGNYGDDNVHAVYTNDLKKVNVTEKEAKHESTGIEIQIKDAKITRDFCRMKHKKIPYYDIGLEFMCVIAKMNPAELGKALADVQLAQS